MGKARSSRNDLDRSSPLPLYVQAKQRLIAMIAGWERTQDRFYSDEELATLFGISRMTVRQALAELVAKGLLTRVRGLGTFVTGRPIEERFTPGMDIRQQWAAHGMPMEVSVLAFARRPADPRSAALLDLAPGTEILATTRLRSAAGIPIALDHRQIPGDLSADWTEAHIKQSLLHRLWERHDVQYGDFSVEAGAAGREELEFLHLPEGAPIISRSLRYFDKAGRCVLAGRTIHRADFMCYAMRIPLVRDGKSRGPRPDKTAATLSGAPRRTSLVPMGFFGDAESD